VLAEAFGEAAGAEQDDRLASEAQPHLPVIGVDVAEGEGEAAEDRGPLGVQQDEKPGDAVFGVEACVVEQPAGLFPAGLVTICASRCRFVVLPQDREHEMGDPVALDADRRVAEQDFF
jgi:hypothetical protein